MESNLTKVTNEPLVEETQEESSVMESNLTKVTNEPLVEETQEESEKAMENVRPETLSVGNPTPKAADDTINATPDAKRVQSPEKKRDSQLDLSPSMEMMVKLVAGKATVNLCFIVGILMILVFSTD